MPTRRKQPPATKPGSEDRSVDGPSGGWKIKAAVALFAMVILAALWGAGAFRGLFAGPKIPLPRQESALSLGMDLKDALAPFPGAEKKLRLFNNDPQFKIVTVTPAPSNDAPTSLDLLFYIPNQKLYFVSSMWDGARSGSVAIDQWAHQYRRWKSPTSGLPENLGDKVVLKEWHFNDGQTEMTLRSLDYAGKVQKWQDLRDAGDEAAQAAFAKYRIEGGS